MSGDGMRAARTFLASFLVLFLEVALIRWMPAYIRLLSYFSNFILLASFLGIGLGCLLAPARFRLFKWFPLVQAIVIAAVYFFRLEVAVPTSGSIYFSSGTAEKVVVVESTMLLPLLFVIVAALFATLAQRMGREMAQLPPLKAYTMNLAGSLAGVVALGLISWLELPPTVWFGLAFAAAVPLLVTAEAPVDGIGGTGGTAQGLDSRDRFQPRAAWRSARARSRHGTRCDLVAVLQDYRRPAGL